MWTTKDVKEITDCLERHEFEITSPPAQSSTARVGSGLYLAVRLTTEEEDEILGVCLADPRNPNVKQVCVWVEYPKGVGSIYWTDPKKNRPLCFQVIDQCKVALSALDKHYNRGI